MTPEASSNNNRSNTCPPEKLTAQAGNVSDTDLSYITFCTDSVIPSKKTIFPNNKPWAPKDLKSVVNKKK